ncbi:MAG: tetratricopeptide repeat protein, partial [Rhodoferax sp.]|nr:tetratricopeptide repeat protein [Rhodoferax sp.]
MTSYRRALEIQPNNPSVHTNLGCALADLGQGQAAEASFRQALALARDHVEALSNLGNTLMQRGELEQAEALQRQALQLRPNYTLALCNLGSVLHAQDRPDEALQSLQQALALQPDNFDALSSQGAMLHGQGRATEAEAKLRKALALQPDSVNTLANLGLAQYAQDRPDEALATLNQALAIKPDYVNALSNLGNTLCVLGRLDEGEAAYCRALELKPDDVAANSNRLFGLNYHPDRSAEEIFAAYQAFEQHVGRVHRAAWRPHLNDRNPARRLRLGYVSPDFKLHSCRHFLEPLLAQHDRQNFEVFAYAQLDYEDDVTARYKTYLDHWVGTRGLSDDALAERIRADGIDILVDVAGHTSGNRLGVFACKPAPVSVSWLGYGYTTGLTAIDYYLCDAHSVPANAQHLFSETPWRLPVGWVYRASEGMGEVSPLPAFERGYVTFGTLTRRIRINHRTIAAWAAILKRVSNSRLVIDSSSFRHEYAQTLLQQQFAAHGIGPERLLLGCHTPPWDTLRGIDIGLDCFPHNSGTTLYESLYM